MFSNFGERVEIENTGLMKCSLVAVVGMTNAGKSTFINKLVGFKASIVTNKVHTTRVKMNSVLNEGNVQLVFTDTPGIFSPKTKLEKFIVKNAWMSMKGADMVVLVLDAKRRICVHVEKIIKRLQRDNIASIAVINKMDLLDEGELATFAERVQLLHKFDRVFTVSSLYGTGVRDLIDYLQESACDGPWLYPEEYRTDATLEFFAAEITREKLYLALRQELPYSLSVVTEQIEEKGDSIIIKQVIYVMKESQKTIVVGADAALIKSVSTAARYELSAMLNKKVHLYLFVKVRKFWQDHLEECVGYS